MEQQVVLEHRLQFILQQVFMKQWITMRAQVLEQQAPLIISKLQNQLELQPLFEQSFLDLF